MATSLIRTTRFICLSQVMAAVEMAPAPGSAEALLPFPKSRLSRGEVPKVISRGGPVQVPYPDTGRLRSARLLCSDDVSQETSARYTAVEPEQWLQRHPEAGSSWPSRPKASHMDGSIHPMAQVTQRLESPDGPNDRSLILIQIETVKT